MMSSRKCRPRNNALWRISLPYQTRFATLPRKGKWGDRQLIPAAWVARSTTSYSDIDSYSGIGAQTGYGFLWWKEDWGYSAIGALGHMIAVIPSKDLVIVHRVAYDPPREDVVSYRDMDTMIRMVIAAAPAGQVVN